MNPRDGRHQELTDVRVAAYEELFGVGPERVYPYADFTPNENESFLIDVYVFRMIGPTDEIEIAVTNGMSDQRMINAKKPDQWARNELIQYLSKCTEGHARRLNEMACVPLFDGFLIGPHHTMGWERPAVPGTPWTDAFYLEPIIRPHQRFSVDVEGDPVTLLWHIPITAEERQFKRKHGANALVDRMGAVNLPWIFDETNRPSLLPNAEDSLVPLFTPALAPILLRAEKLKGSPLTESEVIRIRDEAACMMVTRAQADVVERERGYGDIDPENIWEEWQAMRVDLQESTKVT